MVLEMLTLLNLCSLYNLSPYECYVSYYSRPQNTASGVWFTGQDLTCASPTLPFGTLIALQYHSNIVTVEVTDRGPYSVNADGSVICPLIPHPKRKLDLSVRAFTELVGNTDLGIVDVRILKIELPKED